MSSGALFCYENTLVPIRLFAVMLKKAVHVRIYYQNLKLCYVICNREDRGKLKKVDKEVHIPMCLGSTVYFEHVSDL